MHPQQAIYDELVMIRSLLELILEKRKLRKAEFIDPICEEFYGSNYDEYGTEREQDAYGN